MKIVFMGTPDFAVPSLARILEDGHEVVGVFTQPDKPRGRKMVLTPPPVKVLAQEHGLSVYQPSTLRDGEALETLRQLQPDVIIVVAYGKILPREILTLPPHGCINVHGSLLPRWRGAAPIQWAVIAGDQEAGVATMQMEEGLDTGPVLLTARTEIGARETAGEMFDRLAKMGADVLSRTLAQLDALTPVPQDDSGACYASMLDKKIAVIDWSKTAREIDCLIRGLCPWPVAQTTLHGETLKIHTAHPVDGSGRPGEVLKADAKEGLVVACGEGAICVDVLQAAQGKKMSAGDYLRGHMIEKGTFLGN